MTTQRTILWTVTDPRGLNITLTADVWLAHLAKRPDLVGHLDTVRLCVQDPDEIYFDPASTAKKTPGTRVYFYYKSSILRDEFAGNLVEICIKVVVEPDNVSRGYVQSAMFPNEVRKRAVLEWKKSE